MKLIRNSLFYNPFFINNKKIETIIFFSENGIKYKIERGWFGGSNNEFKEIEFDFKCTNKRKPDFSLDHAYLIQNELYLPISKLEFKIKKNIMEIHELEIKIFDIIDITIKGRKWNDAEFSTYVISEEINFRFQKTKLKIKVENMMYQLQSLGVNISFHQTHELLKVANIEIK